MTREDMMVGVMAANDIALQWYAITQDKPLPGRTGGSVVLSSSPGGVSATFGGGTLLLAALAIVAVVYAIK